MEQLTELLPIDYDNEFYTQFRSHIGAYYNLPTLFLGYLEGYITHEPRNDYEAWARDNAYLEKWPYPELDKRRKSNNKTWREVSERIYWDQLEAVPPACMKSGAFMVGECYTSDKNGSIYTAFCVLNDRYFCRHAYIKNFNPGRYIAEVRDQLETNPEAHYPIFYNEATQ